MKHHRRITSLLAGAALVCATASPAAAQSPGEQEAQQDLLTQSVAAVTSTVVGGLFIWGAMQLNEEKEDLTKEVDLMKQFVLIDRYVGENDRGMRMAFSLGAGDELDELAALVGHDAKLDGAQRRALRSRRIELIEALDARTPGSLESAGRIHSIVTAALGGAHTTEVAR